MNFFTTKKKRERETLSPAEQYYLDVTQGTCEAHLPGPQGTARAQGTETRRPQEGRRAGPSPGRVPAAWPSLLAGDRAPPTAEAV